MTTYQRGDGGITLNQAQLTQLSDDLESAVSEEIESPYDVSLGATIYSDILDDISEITVTDGTVTVTPLAGVNLGVWEWINGAILVNEQSGFAAAFIRDFTIFQYQERGLTGDADPGDLTQEASNNIAIRLAQDIIRHNGQLPGVEGLGNVDAGAAAANVFSRDYAPWAGTLLFPYLGESTFYTDWLLNTQPFSGTDSDGNPQNFKTTQGTYDLVASLEATYWGAKNASLTNPIGALLTAIEGPEGAVQLDQTVLTQETDAFFQAYYYLPEGSPFLPGADLIFNYEGSPSNEYYVTTLQGETLTITEDGSFLPKIRSNLRAMGFLDFGWTRRLDQRRIGNPTCYSLSTT